eukprot:749796-Hanusia_phi.AAC.3
MRMRHPVNPRRHLNLCLVDRRGSPDGVRGLRRSKRRQRRDKSKLRSEAELSITIPSNDLNFKQGWGQVTESSRRSAKSCLYPLHLLLQR